MTFTEHLFGTEFRGPTMSGKTAYRVIHRRRTSACLFRFHLSRWL